MKGLILKDFYMTAKYCKINFLIDIIFIVISFFSANNITFLMFPIIISGVTSITMLSLDERCKWIKYSGSLPYSSAQIVSAKYLFGLIIQAATTLVIFAALLVRVNVMNDADITIEDISLIVGGMFILSLVMPAFCLPFCFGFGTEKGRFAYYIMMIIFAAVAAQFVKANGISDELVKYAPMILTAVVAVYALSWFISIAVYGKRELRD